MHDHVRVHVCLSPRVEFDLTLSQGGSHDFVSFGLQYRWAQADIASIDRCALITFHTMLQLHTHHNRWQQRAVAVNIIIVLSSYQQLASGVLQVQDPMGVRQ